MKLIAITIFCLAITETITTGTPISDTEKHPEASLEKKVAKPNDVTELKVPEVDEGVLKLSPQPTTPTPITLPTIANSTNTTTTTPTTPTTPTTAPTTAPTTPTTPVSPTTKNDTTSTVPPPTTAPTDNPAHKTDRKFDSFSFIAGIVMAAGLMAIGLVAFKFYEARRDRNYHTI